MAALKEELAQSQKLLQCSQQPHGYLISRLGEQREELLTHKARVSQLEEELASVRKEKAVLVETKNQMAADLERLLNHKEVWSSFLHTWL